MEIAGLSVGVISLVALFQTCFDLYGKVADLKHARGDFEEVKVRLAIEMYKIRFIKKKYDIHKIDKDAEGMMTLYLNIISSLLGDISSIVVKNSPRGARGHEDAGALHPGTDGRGISRSPLRKIMWIAGDKNTVNSQLEKLHIYTGYLWTLVSSEAERTRESYMITNRALEDETMLETVAAIPTQGYAGMSKAAKVKRLLLQIQAVSTLSPILSMMSAEGNLDIQDRSTSDPASESKWRFGINSISLVTETKYDWSTGIFHHHSGEVAVVIEWRGPFTNNIDAKANENRLDGLCELLRAMYTADSDENRTHTPQLERNANFGTLKCLGWVMPELLPEVSLVVSSGRIGIVFQFPLQQSRVPQPLSFKILETRRSKMTPPSLGDRFDLAFGICSAIVNIITVGWGHRAVRSDNMLIFDERGIRNVYLVGFTYARSKVKDPQMASMLPSSRRMLLYRPPPAAETGSHRNSMFAANDGIVVGGAGLAAQDLYGLGIVLLEIGLWNTVGTLMEAENMTNVEEFQTMRLEKYISHLSARCGDIYCGVVRKCLNTSNWDDESLKVNIAEIVVRLSRCRA
jgi:hypothetical protein